MASDRVLTVPNLLSLARLVLAIVFFVAVERGQPVAAFEWCADKAGLWACVAYDQYLRGHDGQAQLTVDSQGRPKGQLQLLSRSCSFLRVWANFLANAGSPPRKCFPLFVWWALRVLSLRRQAP